MAAEEPMPDDLLIDVFRPIATQLMALVKERNRLAHELATKNGQLAAYEAALHELLNAVRQPEPVAARQPNGPLEEQKRHADELTELAEQL